MWRRGRNTFGTRKRGSSAMSAVASFVALMCALLSTVSLIARGSTSSEFQSDFKRERSTSLAGSLRWNPSSSESTPHRAQSARAARLSLQSETFALSSRESKSSFVISNDSQSKSSAGYPSTADSSIAQSSMENQGDLLTKQSSDAMTSMPGSMRSADSYTLRGVARLVSRMQGGDGFALVSYRT